VKVALVPPTNVAEVLDEVGPILTRATDRSGGRWSIIDVLDQVETGLQHLWIAFTDERILGVVTTRFVEYPSFRRLEIVFCAGDNLKDWMRPMLDVLGHWHDDNKCTGMELVGRSGWERMLAREGFKKTYIVMEKIK
jgi:hypothetical protein